MSFSTSRSAYMPQRRFSPRIFSFSFFLLFPTHSLPHGGFKSVIQHQAPQKRFSPEILLFSSYFSFFAFFLFLFSILLYLKNKIPFKYRNTSNGTMCTSRWHIKSCIGSKYILWHVPECERPNALTHMTLAIIQPTTGVWREVRKKKGKRGKLDDFYNYTSHCAKNQNNSP